MTGAPTRQFPISSVRHNCLGSPTTSCRGSSAPNALKERTQSGNGIGILDLFNRAARPVGNGAPPLGPLPCLKGGGCTVQAVEPPIRRHGALRPSPRQTETIGRHLRRSAMASSAIAMKVRIIDIAMMIHDSAKGYGHTEPATAEPIAFTPNCHAAMLPRLAECADWPSCSARASHSREEQRSARGAYAAQGDPHQSMDRGLRG